MKLKIIKKNQLAILVISLMLITAGYLNYDTSYNKNDSQETGANLEDSINLASLGDAELVNSDVTENKEGQSEESKNQENKEEQTNVEAQEESKEENKEQENTKQTSTELNNAKQMTATSSDYFTASKLERNVMYSQMIERYQGIVNSSQAAEQKAVAIQEINKINEIQNAIMITENLLTSKNFEKNIIFVNGNSVNVIIGKEKLETEEVAQIQNVVSRELNVEIENIHISMR